MPMLTHPPDAPELPTTHHVVTGRDGDGRLGSAAPRPEVLLPSGGSDQRGGPGAGVMGDAGFRLQVAAIHDQLIPIRSRVALASSYGREASRQRIERLPATVDVAHGRARTGSRPCRWRTPCVGWSWAIRSRPRRRGPASWTARSTEPRSRRVATSSPVAPGDATDRWTSSSGVVLAPGDTKAGWACLPPALLGSERHPAQGGWRGGAERPARRG